ncbi:hypothetical protein KXW01_006466, partial [Aspergillus fumigatus]
MSIPIIPPYSLYCLHKLALSQSINHHSHINIPRPSNSTLPRSHSNKFLLFTLATSSSSTAHCNNKTTQQSL